MKILYYDCFSGISGDMNLGAMIDVGVPKEYLIGELKKLKLSGYEIIVSQDARKGINGTKVQVLLEEEHHHGHNTHAHGHTHISEDNPSQHIHEHSHRGLKEIEEIIENSELNKNVKKLSMNIFMEVAKAEAKVHNKSLYEVHFHEVGAVDSIVDTVGAAIALDYLKADRILCSSVELGGGFVKCAHGIIPVPAPAVVEILKGVPVKTGAVQFETTTPTGAAILKASADEFIDKKNFIIRKTGYGVGQRDTEIPNVLRVFLAETEELQQEEDAEAYVIECNIDDMSPEKYEYIMEGLFELKAADVFLTPIIMKKTRPAVKLSVLCSKDKFKGIRNYIFKETSTLGIRYYKVEKNMLQRDFTKLSTSFGEITVKNAYFEGKKIKRKPEYEECKKIAKEKGLSLTEVYNEINNKL